MLTVVIPRTDETKVVHLTQENCQRELRTLPGSEILIEDSWWEGARKARNKFICMVEPDCVMSSGYFASMVGLFRKNESYHKLAMMSAAVGLNNFADRVFSYELGQVDFGSNELKLHEWHILPSREKRSTSPYPVQVGFLPGAIVRRSSLMTALDDVKPSRDVVEFSTRLSFYFWDTNRRVSVNPNATYVSTDGNLDGPSRFKPEASTKVRNLFEGEQI